MKIALPRLLSLRDEDLAFLANRGYIPTFYTDKDELKGQTLDIYVGFGPIPELKGLKWVQLLSAGLDSVDFERVKKENILLSNARGVYSEPIAEYCMAYILMTYKQLPFFMKNQSEKQWNRDINQKSLRQKKVVFLGAGSIAQATAKRLKAFSAFCIATNSDGRPIAGFDASYRLDDIEAYMPLGDIIINTLPLNDETHHFMDDKVFALLKEDALLINIGRGQTINIESLLRVLDDKLSGVVLDVFPQEPLAQSSPLWQHPKVLITPHLSYSCDLNNEDRLALVLKNLDRFQQGKTLKNQITI